MTRKPFIILAASVGTLAIAGISLGAASANGAVHSSDAQQPPGPLITARATPETPTGSISDGQPITTVEALKFLAADSAEFTSVTSTFATDTTLGDLALNTNFDPQDSYGPAEAVVVVGDVGRFAPVNQRDISFGWGAMVIDTRTGVLIGVFSQPGDVPQLLDHEVD